MNARCVRGVASGTFIGAHPEAGAALLRFDDGTEEVVPRCAHAAAAAAAAPPLPPIWRGWPRHWWWGLSWAPFTSPPLPPNTTIWSLNASWQVPPLPALMRGNASDPWYEAAPTESWWVGVQGGAVLQPVLELNGLHAGAYDGVSWACCAGGMAWYSFPLAALPGERVEGSIVRVSGAEVGSAAQYVYRTVTAVRSAARGYAATTLYSDMSDGERGWAPTWAEVVQESYFVTACGQLPCGGAGAFSELRLATAPAGLPYSESAARVAAVAAPPWSVSYEIEDAAAPAAPVCRGAASAAPGAADVNFDCQAQH